MPNIKMIIAYDGTRYLGWQKTKMGPSIEESLEKAIAQILQSPVTLQAASRTDAGVHAEGQVVNFQLDKPRDYIKLKASINALLPLDIRVLELEEEDPVFHPTLANCGKEYHYHVCYAPVIHPLDRHFFWHFPYPLDLEKMKHAAGLLVGTHDFSSFCNQRKGLGPERIKTVEEIQIISQEGQRLRIEVKGKDFLYKMVRNIVGTLVYVGCGKLTLEEIPLILEGKDRTLAGVTAPAHGLLLKKVFYPSKET